MLWRKTYDLLLTGKGDKKQYVFIKDFNTLNYIVEENISVIVYMFFEQQKNWIIILKIPLKLMVNKPLRCLKKVNMLNSKILKGN